MSLELLIETIVLGSVVLCGIVAIVWAIVRGEIKQYVLDCMAQADFIYKDLPKPEKSIKKLEYVIKSVNEKYGFVKLFLNVKKFIEKVIEIANSLQHKGKEN